MEETLVEFNLSFHYSTGQEAAEGDAGPPPEGDRRAQGELPGGRRGRREQQRLHRRVPVRNEEGGRPRVVRGDTASGEKQ